jgi:hypothetical protein
MYSNRGHHKHAITSIITSHFIYMQAQYIYCSLYNMLEPTPHPRSFGQTPRGITQSDVGHAADSLLRAGERPTIEKIRAKIGKGSPNTINPMLDAWWKTLSARLDSGPAALHRLPESIAHIAEAIWMQATEEARRRVRTEQKTSERQIVHKEQALEVRSHVLTLREGELDSRLRDRERTIEELNLRLRELTGALRKEQVMRESCLQRTTLLESVSAARQRRKRTTRARTPPAARNDKPARRAARVRRLTTRKRAKSRKPRRK